MSITIPLSNGGEALVSEDDYEMLNKYKWFQNNGYVKTNQQTNQGRKMITMHRLIMGIVDRSRYPYVDHINHNTLDNRRENLRLVTPSQNGLNRKKEGPGCVWKQSQTGMWCVRVTVNKQDYNLGCYPTKREASAGKKAASLLIERTAFF